MLLKGFKHYFITVLICVILCYFLLSFFVIGYDEGMNTSKTAIICAKVMKYLTFSLEFWATKIKMPGILAVLLCFLTTTFVISFPLTVIRNKFFSEK